MAEIKSAVELAMERTKNLRLSDQEKETIKEEEFHARAQGLVNRYLGVDLHLRGVEKELEKVAADQRRELEKLMVRLMADLLALDGENELALQGIQAFRPGSERFAAQFKNLTDEYRMRREKEYRKVETRLLKKLSDRGISGSSVVPKGEGSTEWAEELARFQPEFEKKLQSLKEELTA